MIKFPVTPPYYDPTELLKRNPSVAATIGGRGIGKTNFWKRYAIYNFLQTGKQTIFLKRFQNEVVGFRDNFLNDIFVGDPDLAVHDYKIKGNKFYVNDELCAYFVPLSSSITLTGVSYQNVSFMLYDEFLTLGLTVRGVNEETLFMHFLETVMRDRDDFLIVMTSNAVSSTSRYFDMLGFGHGINPKKRFQSPKGLDGQINDTVVVEVYRDKEFVSHKEKSTLYKVFQTSEYRKFAIENEFIGEDYGDIVPNMKGHLNPYCCFITEDGIIEICYFNKVYPYVRMLDRPLMDTDAVYTFDKELVEVGGTFINARHSVSYFLHMSILLKYIRYENMKVKKILLGNIKKIITTYF